MRTATFEVVHLAFFGGWVVKQTTVHTDGPYKGRYVDFPDSTYGVLDSQHVQSYKTKEEAVSMLNRIKKRDDTLFPAAQEAA